MSQKACLNVDECVKEYGSEKKPFYAKCPSMLVLLCQPTTKLVLSSPSQKSARAWRDATKKLEPKLWSTRTLRRCLGKSMSKISGVNINAICINPFFSAGQMTKLSPPALPQSRGVTDKKTFKWKSKPNKLHNSDHRLEQHQREVPSGLLDRLRSQVLRSSDRGPLSPPGHNINPPPPLWRWTGVQEETRNREHAHGSWPWKGTICN